MLLLMLLVFEEWNAWAARFPSFSILVLSFPSTFFAVSFPF